MKRRWKKNINERSRQRGEDRTPQRKNQTWKARFFFPLCLKQINNYSKCALRILNYFSPRRKREDWRMMETRIRWFSLIHLLTSRNIRTWKSRSSYHFPIETNARFWREASLFPVLMRLLQAFILMMRPGFISNQAVQHFFKPQQNYREYRALDLTRFFWTKITICGWISFFSLGDCSLSVRPPHLTPFLPAAWLPSSPGRLFSCCLTRTPFPPADNDPVHSWCHVANTNNNNNHTPFVFLEPLVWCLHQLFLLNTLWWSSAESWRSFCSV